MRNLLLYPLMLLIALALSSCGGSEGVILPELEQPEQPDDNANNDEGNEPAPEDKGRFLVLFCSRSGNTERMAQQIRTVLGCDILEVEPAGTYEDDYNTMLERAQNELTAISAGVYPEIKTSVESFDRYEMVFIGYPIWHGHMATPMQSFLHTHAEKLSAKKIALFATSGSSGISISASEARALCPDVVFTETLHLTSNTISQYENRVTGWLALLGVGNSENNGDGNQQGQDNLKINITIGDRVITATMEDNVTARDFLSRLPLEVTLNDYAGAEKIFYPNPALTTEGAPRGNASLRGDIDLYVPWGDVAFFYKGDGGYSNSMVHLGRIDGNGVEALDVSGDISVRIERQ